VGQGDGAREAIDMIKMRKRNRLKIYRVLMGIFLVLFVFSAVAIGLAMMNTSAK
jgi:hypothetical protein